MRCTAEKMQENYRPYFNLKCRICLSNHFLVRFKSKTKMFAVKIIIRDKHLGKKIYLHYLRKD